MKMTDLEFKNCVCYLVRQSTIINGQLYRIEKDVSEMSTAIRDYNHMSRKLLEHLNVLEESETTDE